MWIHTWLFSLYQSGDAGSTPCPAQSNIPIGGGSGRTWSAGTSTCSEPAAPAPVVTATEQKLSPAARGRSVWQNSFIQYQHRNILKRQVERKSIKDKVNTLPSFPFSNCQWAVVKTDNHLFNITFISISDFAWLDGISKMMRQPYMFSFRSLNTVQNINSTNVLCCSISQVNHTAESAATNQKCFYIFSSLEMFWFLCSGVYGNIFIIYSQKWWFSVLKFWLFFNLCAVIMTILILMFNCFLLLL